MAMKQPLRWTEKSRWELDGKSYAGNDRSRESEKNGDDHKEEAYQANTKSGFDDDDEARMRWKIDDLTMELAHMGTRKS
jgi:hypothetical protein